MNVLDLFSGIGGFSLGFDRAGFNTVAFCEIEDYPRKVLAQNWPDVPIYDDVRTLTAERLKNDGITVDLICGGFPCQDISLAGRQAGIEAERSGLWSECTRLVGELRPRYAIFENVTNLLAGERGEWFKRVLWDLSSLGYDVQWHCIPASELGAHHHRDRVWIIAYPNDSQCQRQCSGPEKCDPAVGGQAYMANTDNDGSPATEERKSAAEGGDRDTTRQISTAEPAGLRAASVDENVANSEELDERARLCESEQGGKRVGRPSDNSCQNDATDTNGNRCNELSGAEQQTKGFVDDGSTQHVANTTSIGVQGQWPSGKQIALAHALEGLLVRCREAGGFPDWEAEPAVGRVADGVPSRAHRIKALGNAVVPQIPELIGHAIMEVETQYGL